MQLFYSKIIYKKTVINQHSNQCPWKYKHCHGKLA